MITFKFNDENCGTDSVSIEVVTTSSHLDAVLEAFRVFLTHVGHHPSNVERVVLEGREERAALPHVRQLDLFKDIP